jgi:hypothetical protein
LASNFGADDSTPLTRSLNDVLRSCPPVALISTPRTVWQIAPRRNFAMLPDGFARQWKARHC